MTNEQTKQKPHPYSQVLQWVAKGKEIEVYHADSGCYLQLDTNTILRIVLAGTDDKSYKQPQDFRLKPQRHIHQDLIDAFENGAEIEQYWDDVWVQIWHPLWSKTSKYRIKPEPKPDIIGYCESLENTEEVYSLALGRVTSNRRYGDNIKVVFCGETNKLKAIELLDNKE